MSEPLDTQAGDIERDLRFSKKLQAVTNKIHATNNLDEIMLDLSQEICELFDCERLTLYAVSKDKQFIFSKVKTGINSKKDLVLPVNTQSIAGYVATCKRSVRIRDAYDEAELKAYAPDLRYLRAVDQITGYRVKQMLASPIVSASTGELLGVIQLLNNRVGDSFTVIAEAGLKELCETLAIAFVQRTKAPLAAHSKYESLVVDSVISAPELELAARWARRKDLDIEEVLVDVFEVKLSAIGQSLAKSFNAPYEAYEPNRHKQMQLLKKLNREAVEKNQWLPLVQDDTGLSVLTTDPEHANDDQAISKMFPFSAIFYRITTKREFRQTIDQFFGAV